MAFLCALNRGRPAPGQEAGQRSSAVEHALRILHELTLHRFARFRRIEELIDIVEAQASCELYGLLKRPDEKVVTERAYDNPKFVEDIVRDIAHQLNQDDRVLSYTVASENFESIHNHSAYALIENVK